MRKGNRFTSLSLAALIAATVACSGTGADPQPSDAPPLLTTEAQASADAAEDTDPAESSVILADDFSDPSTGWLTYDDADGRAEYGEAALVIRDYTDSDALASSGRPGIYVEDAIVDVDMLWLDGTDDNWQVVNLRVDEADNGYSFAISADGWYMIAIHLEGTAEDLIGPAQSEHIRTGQNAVNSVRASAVGSTLGLAVNDHLLAQATDTRLQGGSISFSVASQAGQYSEVAFANLVVTEPH